MSYYILAQTMKIAKECRLIYAIFSCLLLAAINETSSDDNSSVVRAAENVSLTKGVLDVLENVPILDMDTCTIKIGAGSNDIINLKPLAMLDGYPRYNATFSVIMQDMQSTWNYSYNPCMPYSLPHDNPHDKDVFGDGCHSVLMCKYRNETSRLYYYSLGISSQDKVKVELVGTDNETSEVEVVLVYAGIKSLRLSETRIHLVCDDTKMEEHDGVFNITLDDGRFSVYGELHHQCCCVGGCWRRGLGLVPDSDKTDLVGSDGEIMLVVAGFMVGLVMFVALIGGLCYVKRTHLHFYSKLPGISHTEPITNSTDLTLLATPMDGSKYPDFRDYEPAGFSTSKRKLIPVLVDCNVQIQSVEMGQRLGGGIFCDTHLAKWNEITVTLKRLTIAIHNNQLTSDTMNWMKEEVWFLSRQRHKNIVCIIGLCLDGRLPFLLTEHVIGECLKDFLKANGKFLTWPQRVRLCSQVTDGMAFLHSTKPPIIHRDLRCGNLFISDNDFVKVADYGLTKLLQPMREQCQNDDCCCQRQFSAFPAKIRWTAPELLTHPCTKEGQSSIITTACDVYSFALVMWEMVVCKDPFDEISRDAEVIEIVKNGGRPDIPLSDEMMPQFKDLMKSCWDQRPGNRPPFKQVAVRLKEVVGPARSHQKHVTSNKQRLQKQQDQKQLAPV
uniref:Protein kinase domain-containing protein n=1 Tax=Arion vulgaris TaxID=1028688 RepID=A0A0B7AYY0_9EUPU